MNPRWTFSQKLALGFSVVLVLMILSSVLSIRTMRSVVAEKDLVLTENAESLIVAAKFQAAIEWKVASVRGFLITGAESHVVRLQEADARVALLLAELKSHSPTGETARLLTLLEPAEREYSAAASALINLQRQGITMQEISRNFEANVTPKRLALDKLVTDFIATQEGLLRAAKDASTEKAAEAERLTIGIIVATVIAAIVIVTLLARKLSSDIRVAIEHMRTSSAELQSAANQQVTGAREQATSMNEISTTVSELLATSRQIAESSQRVAQIAEDTTNSAKGGDQSMRSAHESITGIKQHVDHVVTYMLDLGKKSQQIGSVVDIITELSEQTNILSINASIEAAGAGESGRRFSVVADEIRKLAERVGGSTREITSIIEEIRTAVNTAVMATEGGAKAVDAGARQFRDVTAAFDHIVKQLTTSADAAREIELSTKQQATAVEQVNIAIVNAAQATKETEASSSQILQTAGQLNTLSGDLTRIV